MLLPDIVKGFREVATASVADAVDKLAGKRGYMDHPIKPPHSAGGLAGMIIALILFRPCTQEAPVGG